MLRTKFLKSFEEKIKEIEFARVSELEEIKNQHQNEMRVFKESCE